MIYPVQIKYFSCGEYGDKYWRPHYHIIIFGYDFADKIFVRMSKSDKPIYDSVTANKLWPEGIITLQDANVTTIAYSALYSSHLKQNLPSHLKKYPEFNTMSNDLGIKQALKKIETYMITDEIFIDGFSYKIPDILLKKYAKDILQYDDDNVKLYIKAYKNNREQKKTVIEELKNKRAISTKKDITLTITAVIKKQKNAIKQKNAKIKKINTKKGRQIKQSAFYPKKAKC